MKWVKASFNQIRVCFEVEFLRGVVHDCRHGRLTHSLRSQLLRPIDLLLDALGVVMVYVFDPTGEAKLTKMMSLLTFYQPCLRFSQPSLSPSQRDLAGMASRT